MEAKHGRLSGIPVMILALALLAHPASAGEKQPPEGKAAVVNGSVITRGDFDREVDRVKQRLSRMGKLPSDSELSEIEKQVLESLINRELLYQESQKQGISIADETIDEQLGKLKGRFASDAEFKSALSDANLSEAAIKSQFKQGMAIQQFIDKEFVQKITVSDDESKTYYDGHPEVFKQPGQVRASHILIKVDPGADESQKAEARRKLDKIQGRLEKGEDFAALAKECSEGPSGANGGDLGYFKRGQMVKPFEEAAFTLEPGTVSEIVETEFGYHLIKVIDKKPEKTIAYEEIKGTLARHLKKEKIQREVSLYVEKLKEKAKVERFLKEGPS
jgi:peptidyl-prolyl cis-trans isomerase C